MPGPTAGQRVASLAVAGLEASATLVRSRGRLGHWAAIAAIALTLAAVSRVVPAYLIHFLLHDDVVEAARAPVGSDEEVRDRLAHAIAARGLRQRIDPRQCQVTSQGHWRHIVCSYHVPVTFLPGLSRNLRFRIDVEEPYVLPRQQ